MVVCGDLCHFVVVCGRLRWFVVVWGGLRWFAMVCLIVIPDGSRQGSNKLIESLLI